MNGSVAFLEDYCTFGEDRVYVVMAVARAKDNPEIVSSSEVAFREVVKDRGDVRRKVERVAAVARSHRSEPAGSLTFRLYVTVNARNALKAYFNFRERTDGWVRDRIYGHEEAVRKFERVDSSWRSELQRPESRDETRFLFDLDEVTDAERDTFLDDLAELTDVDSRRETPNGVHIVTGPFNYNELETDVAYELKTDGMLFLDLVTDGGADE